MIFGLRCWGERRILVARVEVVHSVEARNLDDGIRSLRRAGRWGILPHVMSSEWEL